MKSGLLLCLTLLLIGSIAYFLSFNRNHECQNGSFFIEVYGANKNDTIKIFLDDKLLYKRTYRVEYVGDLHSSESRVIDNYCLYDDSLKITLSLNALDTPFYINKDSIIGTYLASSINSEGFTVFHNYFKGSLREHTPQDWQ
jgi:hypothetical protein